MRQRRPARDIGCFSEPRRHPIGLRTIARPVLLSRPSSHAVGLPPLRQPVARPPSRPLARGRWPPTGPSRLVVAPRARRDHASGSAIPSPTILRVLTDRAPDHSVLHASSRLAPVRQARSPPGRRRMSGARAAGGRGVPGYARVQPVDIVFAVYLQSCRPAIRAAVLDADTDAVLGSTRDPRVCGYLEGSSNPARESDRRVASRLRTAGSAGPQTGWERRNLPKCGTVNAIRPRSEL